jgi:hypothetical protein
MKIEFWDQGDPPPGFELGQIPTDFGVGRAAYKWRETQPGEKSCFEHGKMLELTIWRGDAIITHADGKQERLGHSSMFHGHEVFKLLQEVAQDGIVIEGAP